MKPFAPSDLVFSGSVSVGAAAVSTETSRSALAATGALFGVAETEIRFRDRMTASSRALTIGDHATATRLCFEALAEAEHLFDLALSDTPGAALVAPMICNIACHNAAEVERHRGNHAAALGLESEALTRLVASATDVRQPLLLRVSCVRHLRYALASIACHLKVTARNGVLTSAAERRTLLELLARARVAAAAVSKVVRHLAPPHEANAGQTPLGFARALLAVAQPTLTAMLAATEALVGAAERIDSEHDELAPSRGAIAVDRSGADGRV